MCKSTSHSIYSLKRNVNSAFPLTLRVGRTFANSCKRILQRETKPQLLMYLFIKILVTNMNSSLNSRMYLGHCKTIFQ